MPYWCDTWGFKISIEKTVAVLFTRSPEKPVIQLDIDGKPVKVEKSTKFLGVFFDQQLTWNNHINHVVSKCNKRLNLMRAVSGTRWGATHRALISIYRAVIRSVLDYGAAAYDSASASQLRKIDRIQYSALRLCCGAMKGSAAFTLQVECGETPLHLRRLQQQIKFAVKVKATPNHVAKSIFDNHWTTHYGIFGNNDRHSHKSRTVLRRARQHRRQSSNTGQHSTVDRRCTTDRHNFVAESQQTGVARYLTGTGVV